MIWDGSIYQCNINLKWMGHKKLSANTSDLHKSMFSHFSDASLAENRENYQGTDPSPSMS